MGYGERPMRRQPQNETVQRQWKLVGLVTTATTSLVVAILIGLGLGSLAEARWPFGGLWQAAGALLGIVAGFVEMFQLIHRAHLEDKHSNQR